MNFSMVVLAIILAFILTIGWLFRVFFRGVACGFSHRVTQIDEHVAAGA